jgi:hypothetical protein
MEHRFTSRVVLEFSSGTDNASAKPDGPPKLLAERQI